MSRSGPMETFSCTECGTQVARRSRDIRRTTKQGMRLFCSHKCSAAHGNRPRKVERKPRAGFPSQQELRLVLDYNPVTGIFVWKTNSSPYGPKMAGKIAGSNRGDGYIRIRINGTTYKAHHLAWIYVHGEMHSSPQTDHRDGNPSHNAIANLRPCSPAENHANIKPSNTKSLPRGVARNTRRPVRGKLYVAQISFQKRTFRLGGFDTVEEASAAYLSAARRFYGEFVWEGGTQRTEK